MQETLKQLWLRLSKLGFMKASDSPLWKAKAVKHLLWSFGIVFVSYTTASALSSLFLPFAMKAFGTITVSKSAPVAAAPVNLKDRPNFHEVRKAILDRNLFNIEGEFPSEQDEEAGGGDRKKSDFNANAPCGPSTLKLTLVGTIYLGAGGHSFASIREAGIEDVDIYKVGDLIIGNDQAQIVSVERNRVVINNAGSKECLELSVIDPSRALISTPMGTQTSAQAGMGRGLNTGGDSTSVQLQASFVEKELGDGFGAIIQSARLVPNTDGGRVNGFKIFAIQKGSLFDQVGLKDGDVITQVNHTVMEAENGFALYQAFLDERDISIQVLRNGTTPQALQVQIK